MLKTILHDMEYAMKSEVFETISQKTFVMTWIKILASEIKHLKIMDEKEENCCADECCGCGYQECCPQNFGNQRTTEEM